MLSTNKREAIMALEQEGLNKRDRAAIYRRLNPGKRFEAGLMPGNGGATKDEAHELRIHGAVNEMKELLSD